MPILQDIAHYTTDRVHQALQGASLDFTLDSLCAGMMGGSFHHYRARLDKLTEIVLIAAPDGRCDGVVGSLAVFVRRSGQRHHDPHKIVSFHLDEDDALNGYILECEEGLVVDHPAMRETVLALVEAGCRAAGESFTVVVGQVQAARLT